GGILSITGLLTQSGAATLAGGILTATGGGAWSGPAAISAGGSLLLAGDFSITQSAAFTGSAGSIWLTSGQIAAAGSFNTSIPLKIRGATVTFSGTFGATASIILASGEARFDAAATIGSLQLLGGVLSGAANLTVTSSFYWSAGAMTGPG